MPKAFIVILVNNVNSDYQRGSRGHKARGQGQPFQGQTLSRPRTGMLKAKDQGASVLQTKKKRKKRIFKKIFQAKKVLKIFFQAISN